MAVIAITAHGDFDQPGSNRSLWTAVIQKPINRLQLTREIRRRASFITADVA